MQLLHFDSLIFHKLKGHPWQDNLFSYFIAISMLKTKIIFLDIPLLQSILVLLLQQLLYLPYM